MEQLSFLKKKFLYFQVSEVSRGGGGSAKVRTMSEVLDISFFESFPKGFLQLGDNGHAKSSIGEMRSGQLRLGFKCYLKAPP